MKKTLLILAMALGSVCTFAQGTWQKPIPTKATLLDCQFTDKNQVVTGHYYPSHSIVNQLREKSVDTAAADFRWVATTSEDDLTYLTITCMANYASFLTSATKDNGFVLIAPLENTPGGIECARKIGGKYDTYVMLKDSFSTASVTSVQVEFYQSLYRVNKDRFFIEWTDNKNVWDTVNNRIEINLPILDLPIGMPANPTDGGLRETKKVTLLSSACGKTNLWIRFRYSSQGDADSDVRGYFWMIDDLKVTEGPAVGLQSVRNLYYDNAFHYIPKGLKVPPVRWYGSAYSSGGTNATNVEAVVEAIGQNKQAKSKSVPTMELGVSKQFSIDYDTVAATSMSFPSDNVGSYKVTSKFTSNNAGVSSLDTMTVTIKAQKETSNENTMRWSRDNGYLLQGRYWNTGFNLNTAKFENNDALVTARGYQLCLNYKLDSTETDSVYINGIQYVVGTKSRAEAQIRPNIYEQEALGASINMRDVTSNMFPNASYILAPGDIPAVEALTPSPKAFNVEVSEGRYMKPGYLYRACYTINSTEQPFYIAVDAASASGTSIKNFGSGVANITMVPDAFAGGQITAIPRDFSQVVPMIRLLVGNHKNINPFGIDKMSAGSFRLSNYPNPATASTTISYELPVAATVSIELRDITGRVLKVVQLGKKGVGEDTYQLDLSSYASGSYFYTLKANGLSETKKLIIVK